MRLGMNSQPPPTNQTFKQKRRPLAQPVEYWTLNPDVVGPKPTRPSTFPQQPTHAGLQ